MIKNIILTTLFLFTMSAFSQQKNINNYKYVIVPSQFEWLKTADKYQINSLTKFLFKKYGFNAFLSDEELPQDLAENKCLALIVNVKNNSSMLMTKNSIVLKNCANKIVFTSIEGKSKNKDYKRAYHEAIRNAFSSFEKFNYSYVSNQGKNIETKEENVVAVVVNPGVQVPQKKRCRN